MGKLLFSATTSLDGFLAGPGGDMAWLLPFFGPNPDVDWVMESTGSLLMGRTTWDGDDPNAGTDEEGAFGGQWDGPQVVVTHRVPQRSAERVSFLDDLPTAITEAREAAGDRYANVLGADVGRQCLELGELDEILVIVAPVLLGGGTRMFDLRGRPDVDLETISVTHAPLATNMHFRVRYR